jgi:hypothetical protein
LVLFSAYVMQVKHQPYMSTAQRREVILDHQEKAKNGHALHVALAARIREAVLEAAGVRKVIRTKAYSLGNNSFGERKNREKERKERHKKREYFWDYNTVEQVLLSCGIFVCLAGVMFESDRFASDEDGVDQPGKAR